MKLVGKLLLLLSKLSLRHSLEINELQSATFKTIVMGSRSSVRRRKLPAPSLKRPRTPERHATTKQSTNWVSRSTTAGQL